MSTEPSNIYEAGQGLQEEKERLANFDLPTQVSAETIGTIAAGARVLDIGAGPNTNLFRYVQAQGGIYVALDKNGDFLQQQERAGAEVVNADIRELPFNDGEFDITHARFVISHLGDDKQKAIRETLRLTKPGGKAIFLDYDWTTAHGSKAFEAVKDFMINGGFLFDADFGAGLEPEVRKASTDGRATSRLFPPTHMTDYAQILKLREAGTTDLKVQGKDALLPKWNALIDDLQKEAEAADAPGFYFPGVVAVMVSKNYE